MFLLCSPCPGWHVGHTVSPRSLQLQEATLSSAAQLPAGSLCRAPSSAEAAPALGSGNTSHCGPSGRGAGAASSHHQAAGCCSLLSLTSRFYHPLVTIPVFYTTLPLSERPKWFLFPNLTLTDTASKSEYISDYVCLIILGF